MCASSIWKILRCFGRHETTALNIIANISNKNPKTGLVNDIANCNNYVEFVGHLILQRFVVSTCYFN